MRLALLPVLVLALAACGDSDPIEADSHGAGGSGGTGGTEAPGGSGGTGGSGGGGLEPPEVVWGSCPDGVGTCTTFDVPIDWDEPTGGTLPFFVRRIPSPTQPSLGQLWLLQGGPGSAGWMFAHVADDFQEMAPGYDLLIPDYRGTGYSAWLGCEGDRPGSLVRSCFDEL